MLTHSSDIEKQVLEKCLLEKEHLCYENASKIRFILALLYCFDYRRMNPISKRLHSGETNLWMFTKQQITRKKFHSFSFRDPFQHDVVGNNILLTQTIYASLNLTKLKLKKVFGSLKQKQSIKCKRYLRSPQNKTSISEIWLKATWRKSVFNLFHFSFLFILKQQNSAEKYLTRF